MAAVREAVRLRHYSRRTEEAYVNWIRRFVVFHGRRHPRNLGQAEISAFLTDLAVRGRVSASTQNQALAALQFLYREVLDLPAEWATDAVRAKPSQRLPLVLTVEEVRRVLDRMTGEPRLVALLLYGAGLRLEEALSLRVKDLDFEKRSITVRGGKGCEGSGDDAPRKRGPGPRAPSGACACTA